MSAKIGLLRVLPNRRFAACVSGLASGVALAVRPAGAAEASGVNGMPQAHRIGC